MRSGLKIWYNGLMGVWSSYTLTLNVPVPDYFHSYLTTILHIVFGTSRGGDVRGVGL